VKLSALLLLLLSLLIDDDVDDTVDADTPCRADIITAYCVLITEPEVLHALVHTKSLRSRSH